MEKKEKLLAGLLIVMLLLLASSVYFGVRGVQYTIRIMRKMDEAQISRILQRQNGVWEISGVKFYIPYYPIDFIQRELVRKGEFWEKNLLREIEPYLPKKAVILDIGANIGNHSLYWAKKNGAKAVYAFEPVGYTFDILKKNVEINEVQDIIKVFNVGLSDQNTQGDIIFEPISNIGATQIRKCKEGDIVLRKLDDIEIPEATIDFVKIDVEGHELFVLKGAEKTLRKYKPLIFIEILENFKEVDEYLAGLGYKRYKDLEQANFIYKYAAELQN